VKVLLLNNYSMRSALSRVRNGAYPPQHLYGHGDARPVSQRQTTWLPVGVSLFDVVRGSGRGWRALRAVVMRTIGDPLQELAVLTNRKRIDVVFAADQWSAGGLLALKRLGMSLPPIMVLVHHPPQSSQQLRRLTAAERLVVLGPAAAEALERATGIRPRTLPWGPDPEADVYRRARDPEAAPRYDFVAAGRTNRDYTALRELAAADGLTGVVFDGILRWDFVDGTVQQQPQSEDYREILVEMARARCVVMPFAREDVMSGLTEATDAMALDIPILATRSSAFPYDLEATRSGVVAGRNSVAGLRAGLAELETVSRRAGRLLATHDLGQYEAALDSELVAVVRTAAVRA